MDNKFWKLEESDSMTLWVTYDADINLIDYYFSFDGSIRHDKIEKVTQDSLIVVLADKFDTPETEREIIDFEATEAAHQDHIDSLSGVL